MVSSRQRRCITAIRWSPGTSLTLREPVCRSSTCGRDRHGPDAARAMRPPDGADWLCCPASGSCRLTSSCARLAGTCHLEPLALRLSRMDLVHGAREQPTGHTPGTVWAQSPHLAGVARAAEGVDFGDAERRPAEIRVAAGRVLGADSGERPQHAGLDWRAA